LVHGSDRLLATTILAEAKPAMGVMTVPSLSGARSNTYVFHADEFHTAPIGQHFTASKGHSFWPLSFNADGTIQKIDCSPGTSLTFHAPPGTVAIPTIGRATNATDGSGNYGDCRSETGLLDQRYLYQTWTSSKSGTLTEISVNLACNTPTANPLAITVFRYQNEAQFLSPFFNWEVLATLVIGQTAAGVRLASKSKEYLSTRRFRGVIGWESHSRFRVRFRPQLSCSVHVCCRIPLAPKRTVCFTLCRGVMCL
jgi:hypothetical protein